jgi:UPF0716 protein FxsA
MVWKLVLLFTVVPSLEVLVLVLLSRAVGPLPTIGLCLLTGVAGAWLARLEGLETMRRLHQAISSNLFPAMEIAHGCAILVGATLLLTPGLLTDLVGFGLLVPATRSRLLAYAKRRWDLKRGIVEVMAEDVVRDPGGPQPGAPGSGK